MSPRIRAFGPIVALTLALSSCGSKESISLSAFVQNVQLQAEPKTLGTQLTGSFELFLELGAEASGGTQVSLETFALVRGAETLVAPLQALPEGVTFPLSLGKGKKQIVKFNLDDSAVLDAALKASLCSGPVRVRGAVSDTLGGGRTPLESIDVTIGGC
ncbi:MAG TPA: hypothetical protein PKA88_16045 [Polyangiaceae bacterium]|nr:hypothetical protein [Polyangiaceae bacterium]HMR78462.1 hypothetical protein [Polyangiaceae bacterium]